jgi:hypothetical protein
VHSRSIKALKPLIVELHTGMQETSMNEDGVPQYIFFGIGVVTAAGVAAYIAGTYGEKMIAELGWLICGIEVKAKKVANKLLPLFRSIFPEPEPVEVKLYRSGKIVEQLSYLTALNYEPKAIYDLVSYTVQDDTGAAYIAFHSDIKMLTDKVKTSSKRFLTAMVNKGGTNIEVQLPEGVNPYVVGNTLFNPPYLRWAGLDIDDEAEYTVHLIDSDIVQKTIMWNSTNREVIRMTEDGYAIDKIKTETNSDSIESTDDGSIISWFSLWRYRDKRD